MIGDSTVTETEKAYIAGIIDGEGTVTLVRGHRNETHAPEVSVANTNLDLLEWLRQKIGSGVILKKQRKLSHHSLAYTLKVRDNHAIRLLNDIKQWLIIKRRHAELITGRYKKPTPRNGKYTDEMLRKKLEFVFELKKLNAR